MIFKNSVKLLTANFSTVWKLILYYIIVIGISIGLLAPFFSVLGPAFNPMLGDLGKLLINFNVAANFITFITNLNVLLLALINAYLNLFITNLWVAIYITVIITYIMPLLFGLADLAVGQTLFGYMSSLTRYTFTGSYARMLTRSFRFQLMKNLIFLPFNILIFTVFMLTLKLTTIGGLMVYFLPVIVIVPLIILIALKRTIFSGWMPAIVIYNCNMFVALGKGIQTAFKRFFVAFSTVLIMLVIVFGFSYIFGTYALLVIIPLSIMMFYIFDMVMFYTGQGMRFYVDIDTIVKTKLLEESDSFKKVKNLI